MVTERADLPALHTASEALNAFYALAAAEAREAAVAQISDGSFAGGAPIECAPPGCLETG